MRRDRGGPDVGPVLEMLRRRMGLEFPPNRRSEPIAAIRRCMTDQRLSDPETFLHRVEKDRELMSALVAACTVGETYFLREPEQLDYIRREVLPEIAERRRSGPVRVWSAGCATGEEAYSLAILLGESGLAGRAAVLGTDAARPRLTGARRGRYTRWSLRGVPDRVVRRYFRQSGKHFDLDPSIRKAVDFRYLNLAEDTYPSSGSGVWEVDLLLCRNVLIYLERDALPGVAERLYRALAPGGWLFLAASDPSLAELAPFETVTTERGIAYRRPLTSPVGRSLAHPIPDVLAPAPEAPPAPSPMAGTDARQPMPRRPPTRRAKRPAPETDAAGDAARDAAAIRALADRGRLTEAARACAAALERNGTSTELLYLHALLLTEAGHLREAVSAARRALYLRHDLAVAHLVLGSAQARLDEPSAALRSFRNAVRALEGLDPGDPVPDSGGESAGRLLELARTQVRLLEAAA